MKRTREIVLGALTSLAVLSSSAAGESGPASESGTSSPGPSVMRQESASPGGAWKDGLEPLVPEIAGDPYRLEPGVREFRYRLSVSPGYGFFGSDRQFALRVAYNPNQWLGYEASIGHDTGHAVHAVLHSFSAVVRRPLSGRFQPYLAGGYGMLMVFTGQSVNAAPVTKNALAMGGGLEFYIRSDLALRTDLRGATVFGKQRDREGIVAYDYLQGTVGLAFYRSIQP